MVKQKGRRDYMKKKRERMDQPTYQTESRCPEKEKIHFPLKYCNQWSARETDREKRENLHK